MVSSVCSSPTKRVDCGEHHSIAFKLCSFCLNTSKKFLEIDDRSFASDHTNFIACVTSVPVFISIVSNVIFIRSNR